MKKKKCSLDSFFQEYPPLLEIILERISSRFFLGMRENNSFLTMLLLVILSQSEIY